MTWHVAYRRSARDDLASIWIASTDNSAITDAANRIDELLAADPLGLG
jgi:hypothetical protein